MGGYDAKLDTTSKPTKAMTQFERDEAMMSLIHHNMQLGKVVTLVGQLFQNVSPEVSARLYPVWAEAYRSALQEMQKAYNLGVTEERAKYDHLNQTDL